MLKYDLHTFQSVDKPLQLFPKTLVMKPKSIRIHSADTFGVVFQTGSIILCKKSITGEMMVVSKLFQSNEALKLKDS